MDWSQVTGRGWEALYGGPPDSVKKPVGDARGEVRVDRAARRRDLVQSHVWPDGFFGGATERGPGEWITYLNPQCERCGFSYDDVVDIRLRCVR